MLIIECATGKKPQPKHGEVKLETLLGFSHSLVVPTDRQYSSQIIPFFIASPVSSVASAFAAADTTTAAATFQR